MDKRQALNGVHKRKRKGYGLQVKTHGYYGMFRNWMWVDSKVFQQNKVSLHRRWQPRRSRMVQYTVKHPNQLHMYSAMTANGVASLRTVSGTTGYKLFGTKGVGAREFVSVIHNTLVPEGSRLFHGEPFTVYLDGAPAHTAKVTKAAWETYPDIKVVMGPPCSPDLNPIENLWAIVDRKMMGLTFKSQAAFENALRREWANLPVNLCQKLAESMPKRIDMVSKSGGHIERNLYS